MDTHITTKTAVIVEFDGIVVVPAGTIFSIHNAALGGAGTVTRAVKEAIEQALRDAGLVNNPTVHVREVTRRQSSHRSEAGTLAMADQQALPPPRRTITDSPQA